MAQFTIYRSTDVAAPVLNGITGSMITVLDAVLVNGYGTTTSAGWTRPYVATNVNNTNTMAVYKQGSGSCGFYMWVQDSGSVSSGRQAIYRGFETAQNVNLHTTNSVFSFPNSASATGLTANGLVMQKSATADTVVRPWIAFADSRTLYMFILNGGTAASYETVCFGEFYSMAQSDPYRCLIIGDNAEGAYLGASARFATLIISVGGTAILGHYFARNHITTNPATPFSKHTDVAKMASVLYMGGGTVAQTVGLPNGSDGGIYLAPIWLIDITTGGVNTVRGRLRGIWNVCHNATGFSDGDTFGGIGDLAGRTFQIVKWVTESTVASSAYIAVETSNTLETN